MTGVDGCEPDAAGDDAEQDAQRQGGAGLEGVDEGDKHVSRMKRGQGGKHVGVASIEAVKHGEARHLVKGTQAGHFAGSVEHHLEAVAGNVPGRRRRMDVITGKAQQVDQQKHPRKMEIHTALAVVVKPQAEQDGHRHPAEIEHAGHEVHHRAGVAGKELVGREQAVRRLQAEEALLGLVQSLRVHGVHLVVRQQIHPVIRHGEQDERQQRHHQLTAGLAGKKQGRNEQGHQWMLRTETDEGTRHAQPHSQQNDYPQGLFTGW